MSKTAGKGIERRLASWGLSLTLGAIPVCAPAQGIRTDGSVGPAQILAGPNYLIPQSLGKLAGANLFHSFQTFNIALGESATFTTITPGINSVISRVTGGTPSTLNGKLSLSAADGAPAFYFINPAGVVFGAGAAIDVPGAFHVGTADYVKFPDGNFYADPVKASTFSAAPPEAFGFLGGPPASLAVKNGASLSAAPGQAISLVAGDVTVDNGLISAQGGNIRIAALGTTSQEVLLAGDLAYAAGGSLSLIHGGQIYLAPNATGQAGTIEILAGSLTIDSQGSRWLTGIVSQAGQGSVGDAGDIKVVVTGDLTILRGGEISSSTAGAGSTAKVRIEAANLAIDGQGSRQFTGIGSEVAAGSTGVAKEVSIAVSGELSLTHGGSILSSTYATGSAGNVSIEADRLLINGEGTFKVTGISSEADFGSTGNAGKVSIVASSVTILKGGLIDSSTFGAGRAGEVAVQAETLTIDGQGSRVFTGISSDARESTGNAGNVDITVAGALALANGGAIASSTFAAGQAGTIQIQAGSLTIDGQGSSVVTGISTQANSSSTGNAGDVRINVAGEIAIADGGIITSNTFSTGQAGTVQVRAGSLSVDGGTSNLMTGISSDARGSTGNAGSIDVAVAGELALANSGTITSMTFAGGQAGTIHIEAGSLSIDGRDRSTLTGISSRANPGSTGKAGDVSVDVAGQVAIADGGSISSDTYGAGQAGNVQVKAGSLSMDGRGSTWFTGISSLAAIGSTGDGGNVSVVADTLSLLNGGAISSTTFGSGQAGTVKIQAGTLNADAQGNDSVQTGIFSQASPESTGNAGNLDVAVDGAISLVDGAMISSSTFGSGQGGTVAVQAGSIAIDGRGYAGITGIGSQATPGSSGNAGNVSIVAGQISLIDGGTIASDTYAAGHAGTVEVQAASLGIDARGNAQVLTGISSQANLGSSGNAGNVRVAVSGELGIANGGAISSSTFGSGHAGTVQVQADVLTVDGQGSDGFTGIASKADRGSSGNAGNLNIAVAGQLSLSNGGEISSDTFGSGTAGTVEVQAGNLSIDGRGSRGFTGIASQAEPGSAGNAGDVRVAVDAALTITDGGLVSSSTFAAGRAGAVQVEAASILVDGTSSIEALAAAGSSGQTGQVTVTASASITLANGGKLSIENNALVAEPGNFSPSRLTVSAPTISLGNGGQITSSSSGNLPASDVEVTFRNTLSLESTRISTSANLGNGGSILIQGGEVVRLDDSQITTSVSGLAGNGGDISIRAESLVLNTGFVQANTAARPGVGGNVDIAVRNLVPNGSSLMLGGSEPFAFEAGVFGFNVIQAAAPDGVSGTVKVSVPQLDLSGKLGRLTVQRVESGSLFRGRCQSSGDSSLAAVGRGGLPTLARNFLGMEDDGLSTPSLSNPVAVTLEVDEPLRLAQASGCR